MTKGNKLNSFYQGFRSEYIAHFILSNYALVTTVNVSEDIGIDSFCTLFNVNEKFIMPEKLFAVQIKSKGNEIKLTKFHIQYLCSLDIPLFLVIVDKETSKIDIYSMQTIKHFGLKYSLKEIIDTEKEVNFRVKLVDNLKKYKSFFNQLFPSQGVRWTKFIQNKGNKISLDVPFINIISDLDTTKYRDETTYNILKQHIENEYKNTSRRKNYLPFMKDIINNQEMRISYYHKQNYENQIYEKLAIRLLMSQIHLNTCNSDEEFKDDINKLLNKIGNKLKKNGEFEDFKRFFNQQNDKSQ